MEICKTYTLVYTTHDGAASETWTGDSLQQLLLTHIKTWDATLGLYADYVADHKRIPLGNSYEFDQLAQLPAGRYVVFRGAGFLPFLVVLAIGFIALVAVAYLLQPPVPTIPTTSRDSSGQSNRLSQRRNEARPLERIPDLYGRTLVVPDLIAPAYVVFEKGVEVEYGAYCVTRGEVIVHGVYEGEVPLDTLDNSTAAVYRPNTYPSINQQPQHFVGTPQWPTANFEFDEFLYVREYTALNGQTLPKPKAPLSRSLVLTFGADGSISKEFGVLPFDEDYAVGDKIVLDSSTDLFLGLPPRTLTGTFRVVRATSSIFYVEMQVSDPALFDGIDVDTRLVFREIKLAIFAAGVRELNVADFFYVTEKPNSTTLRFGYTKSGTFAPWLRGDGVTLSSRDIEFLLDRGLNAAYGFSADTLTQTFDSASPARFNLNGEYTITAVYPSVMFLSDVRQVNPNWQSLTTLTEAQRTVVYPMTRVERPWLGEIELNPINREQWFGGTLWVNITASQGFYQSNGNGDKFGLVLGLELEVNWRYADGSLAVTTYGEGTFYGGPDSLQGLGLSLYIYTVDMSFIPPANTKAFLRVRRRALVEEAGINYTDALQVQQIYFGRKPLESEYARMGDVTTLFTRVAANVSTTSVSERRVVVDATRVLRGVDSTGAPYVTADANLPAILNAMVNDPHISRGAVTGFSAGSPEDSEYFAAMARIGLFGKEFGHVFDDSKISFEEMVDVVASAYFGKAYRRGSQMVVEYATANNVPTLLLTHRNTLASNSTRTLALGSKRRFDGVEVTFRDATDFDRPKTIFIPADKSAVNPQKVELRGVRDEQWAQTHAWRLYNKIQYQRNGLDITVLEEGALLTPEATVLVADFSNAEYFDGEVLALAGDLRTVTLSQPIQDLFEVPAGAMTLQLQRPDGTTSSHGVEAVVSDDTIRLAEPISFNVNTDAMEAVVTQYILTLDTGVYSANVYRVAEKEERDNQLWSVKLVQDDQRIYKNDPANA